MRSSHRRSRVDPALEADLDGAAVPRLVRAADDLLVRHHVRGAAQVLGELAFRERAEAALEVADVRVVDVPRDDVGDLVAVHLAAQRVGGGEDAVELVAAGGERRATSSSPSSPVVIGSASRGMNGAAVSAPADPASSRASPSRVRRAMRPAVSARWHQPSRVEDTRGRPAAGARARAHVLPWRPAAARIPPTHVVTWLIVTGEYTAPVVDPGIEEAGEVVVGEVRRGTGRATPAGSTSRADCGGPEQVVERGLGVSGHLRARLRAGSSGRSPPGCGRARGGGRRSPRAPRSAPLGSRRSRSGSRW